VQGVLKKDDMSRVEQIIECFLNDEQAENTQRTFFLWLRHPSSTSEKDRSLYAQWDGIQAVDDSDAEASFGQLTERLGGTKPATKRRTARSLMFRIARIAAMFLIPLFSLATAYWFVQSRQPVELNLVTCFVPKGEIKEIALPDGSVAILNSGTTLIYPENFTGNNRPVYLNGEAKFTVAKDPEKTFVVKTKDMDVNALGTVFNVSSYSDNCQTVATLVQGSVQVDIKADDEQSFLLKPSEQVVYNSLTKTVEHKTVRIEYVLAWERGQMAFQSAPLYEIISEMERCYNVKVFLNSTDLNDEKLTVKFLNDESLAEILHTLQQIIKGFHYKIDNDKIYIY
jgi:ferric-dicitrate binding protein FerR (iron transport regulator)